MGFNPPYKTDEDPDDDNRDEMNLDENEYCGGYDERTKPDDLGYTVSNIQQSQYPIICMNPIKGRYVMIQSSSEFSICEVEVYAEPSK